MLHLCVASAFSPVFIKDDMASALGRPRRRRSLSGVRIGVPLTLLTAALSRAWSGVSGLSAIFGASGVHFQGRTDVSRGDDIFSAFPVSTTYPLIRFGDINNGSMSVSEKNIFANKER